jgi:hypothetical protein
MKPKIIQENTPGNNAVKSNYMYSGITLTNNMLKNVGTQLVATICLDLMTVFPYSYHKPVDFFGKFVHKTFNKFHLLSEGNPAA